jgi:hypothetical protein
MAGIEEKAINTLLHKGVKFWVKTRILGFSVKIPFRIKPLYLGTILKLSKQRTLLKSVDENGELVWEVLEKGDNVKAFARCIAIAALNSPTKMFLFEYLLYRFFLANLPMEQAGELIVVVVSQMNARSFFFTTALVKGIQIVDRTENSEQDMSRKKQSGEPSGKSQKS